MQMLAHLSAHKLFEHLSAALFLHLSQGLNSWYWGMVIPPLIGNPYSGYITGYINHYFGVDDHFAGSLDPWNGAWLHLWPQPRLPSPICKLPRTNFSCLQSQLGAWKLTFWNHGSYVRFFFFTKWIMIYLGLSPLPGCQSPLGLLHF